MTDKVVSLVPSITAHGNGEVIEALEIMLGEARDGTVNAVAIACCDTEGGTRTNYTFKDGVAKATLMGAVARLQYRMLEDDEK